MSGGQIIIEQSLSHVDGVTQIKVMIPEIEQGYPFFKRERGGRIVCAEGNSGGVQKPGSLQIGFVGGERRMKASKADVFASVSQRGAIMYLTVFADDGAYTFIMLFLRRYWTAHRVYPFPNNILYSIPFFEESVYLEIFCSPVSYTDISDRHIVRLCLWYAVRKDRTMYKKAMSALVLCNLIFLAGFLCVRGVDMAQLFSKPAFQIHLTLQELEERAEERGAEPGQESRALGIVDVAVSGQRIVDYSVMEKEFAYSLDDANLEVLLRIVEAEAGGEDEDGKLLVANVVLNRVNNEKFPSTVTEVVFQRENGVTQFSPVSNGKYYQVEVSEETCDAVERALKGEDISQGALYFAARKYADSTKMKWFDENLTFLFEHGGHEFFK